ncbi:ferritin-like domain-containing protein [Halosolutus gelatinilyticus]|uniref:YciE/YciF ferroxidase family protein n=1 Tax=Halosolutus gelatinilyticus TaxID=2931975 RepID=UPI001FF2088F|nr:DUF892 family protein [Halosolutus gelatinilyticus]
MNLETLEDLFGHRLQHVYYAERTHVELLSEMAADAEHDLADRFAAHRDRTETHVERLEDAFAALGRRPTASRSRAVDGLAESRRVRLDAGEPPAVVDFEIGLAAERLEIRSYEMLLRLAGRLAYADDVTAPLEATLEEEREALDAFENVESDLSLPVATGSERD